MNIGQLPFTELYQQTNNPHGICFRVGPFQVRLRSGELDFIETFRDLYCDFPILVGEQIIDFHIDMKPPGNYRRWFKPQVIARIDGDEPFQPFAKAYAMPLFEWAFNWAIARQTQQYLILHAAVLERRGQALILPALPGSGKSTLAAALTQRGWRFLSDEFCIVQRSTGQILPIPRPTPLKNESIAVIQSFAQDVFIGPLFPNTRKGTIGHLRAPKASIEQMDVSAQPTWIMFPKYQTGASTSITPLAHADAFLKLAKNSFNYSLLGATGFNLIKDLLSTSTCYDLCYSNLDEVIHAIDNTTV